MASISSAQYALILFIQTLVLYKSFTYLLTVNDNEMTQSYHCQSQWALSEHEDLLCSQIHHQESLADLQTEKYGHCPSTKDIHLTIKLQ